MPWVPPPLKHQHTHSFRTVSDGWAGSTALCHNSISLKCPQCSCTLSFPQDLTDITQTPPECQQRVEGKARTWLCVCCSCNTISLRIIFPPHSRRSEAVRGYGEVTQPCSPQTGAAARGDAAPGAAAHGHAGGCPGVGCGHSMRQ